MFKLVSEIVNVNWTDSRKSFIHKKITELKNQEDFFDYCLQYKVAPWVFVQLKRFKILALLKRGIQEKFFEEYQKVKLQNENRNKKAVEFLRIFKEEKIDVIILKGNYFATTVYKDVGYKRMNDFDILVHKKDWDRIQNVYLKLGYIPLGFGWSGEKEEPADYSHVGMAFISNDFTCIIGTQWGLKSPTTSYQVPIDEIWNSTKNFSFEGVDVKTMSPEFNLLHLILHLGIYKCGVRDLMDLFNFVQIEKIDENLMLDIIKRSNAVDKANFALTLSNKCQNVFSSIFILKLSNPNNSFINRRLSKRIKMMDESNDIHYSYNDYFQDIEKVVVYFNLFPLFHKKIKYYLIILKMIFFPTMDTCLRLNDEFPSPSFSSKLIARMKAPYFSFALIAQEIGWKFTLLLFLKLFLDLILSIKNYFIKKESYSDYLVSRNISLQKIENAVKNIQ